LVTILLIFSEKINFNRFFNQNLSLRSRFLGGFLFIVTKSFLFYLRYAHVMVTNQHADKHPAIYANKLLS